MYLYAGHKCLLVVVATFISLLTLKDTTYSQTVETYISNVGNSCTDSDQQLCYPIFSVSVTTTSLLQVQFFVHPDHCTSVRVHFFVDEAFKASSGFLGWPGAPPPFDVLPLDTGLLNLGNVPPGTHLVGVQGEGQVGGCNSGQLFGWGGGLTILTSTVSLGRDDDRDGVSNDPDICPNTLSGSVVDASGCSISQLSPCSYKWKNHGQYVSVVAHTAADFVAANLITTAQQNVIVSNAGKSSCGKK